MLGLSTTTRWARVLCLGLASTIGGCSFFFVDRPRTGSGYYGHVGCTSSAVVPTLDVMFTAFQMARTAIAISASDQDYQGMTLSRGGDIGLGFALTMIGAASTAYGFSSINECRERGGGSPAGAGTLVGPQPQRTHAQRAAEEAAEEAAVQARVKIRAAAAARAAEDAKDAGAADGRSDGG